MAHNALIGYTGFVGGNLAAQSTFSDYYNTKNIDDIRGKSYDLVVSAATYAEMWKINQDPEGDMARIQGLIDHLKQVKAKQFVLISTVGVYKDTTNVSEKTPIELDGLPPYGVNRYYLEQFVRQQFNGLIVRLPGLFGQGLKKNVIFDLIHHNNVERIHYAGTYQYYDLARLWGDIQTALRHNLQLVNMATEPIRTDELAKACFGIEQFDNQPADVTPAHWDIHSDHADVYGGEHGYLYDKKTMLRDIKAFVGSQKAAV